VNLDTARADFPALAPDRPGGPLVYLDSACMTLVPRPVLETIGRHYVDAPGCGGRGVHRLSEEVARRFESDRAQFARWFGRADESGVVFVRNATEAINLVAQGFAWRRGDRVLISDREHNSNLVVWQTLVRERGIELDILPLSDDGTFDAEPLEAALARGVRLVSLFHTSNLDGRTLPMREIVERAHDRNASVLFDGCQAAPHLKLDLDRDGVDYYAVSAHKFMGPTGFGALLAGPGALDGLRPLLFGGEAVEETRLADHRLKPPPHRFEAGLQDYAGAAGARAALDYLARAGPEEVEARQRELNTLVTRAFDGEPRVHLLGPPDPAARPSIFSFTVDGLDPNDVALFLDESRQAMVRSGRHCVHSYYDARGLVGSVRASFYLYNHRADAQALIDGVRELLERAGGGAASGTSAGTSTPAPRRPSARRPSAGSRGAAARSAPPRRRAARGRAGSAKGTG
jgi:cysteine desulfurase/selenocysteine lyase